jgi:hypothetical protein
VRDAVSEAAFFQVYGNLFSLYLADRPERPQPGRAQTGDPRDLPVVKDALAAIEEGGYAEAVARVGALLAPVMGKPLPLERLHLRHELIDDYRALLPETQPDEQRRIRGEQDTIVRYERERAVATLPVLLKSAPDRKRLLTLFERVLADTRIQGMEATADQREMFQRIRTTLRARPEALAGSAPMKSLRET